VVIANGKTQTEAAKQLGCHQASISRYLSDLELWLGKQLFTQKSPYLLTEEAEAFRATVTTVLRLMDESRASVGLKVRVSARDIVVP
jgi:DNA-binding transcriptional LysR family regulator